MSKEKTSFVYVTYIRSTPEKVFEAITKPEIARRYWGHENVSDWKPGSTWEHVRANEQRTVELVGKVVEIAPPTRLVITWANASQAADPASYSRVSFDIAAYEEMVRLTVTHDELEAGSGMAKGIQQGWPIVLSSLKSLLETGQGIDVFAKPKAASSRESFMTQPYTGGCACGAIRYATKHAPVFQNHCQCRDCQRRSGTGHGSYLTFPARAEMAITGEATHWEVAGDSGNVKVHAFCPVCGTPVYLRFAAMPELIAVHAGSLDEPGRFAPQVLTYSVRGLAWDAIDPSLQAFERMPPG